MEQEADEEECEKEKCAARERKFLKPKNFMKKAASISKQQEAGDQGFGSEGHRVPGWRLDSNTSLRNAAHRTMKSFGLKVILYSEDAPSEKVYSPNRNAQGLALTGAGRALGPLERVSRPLADRSVDATTRDLTGVVAFNLGAKFQESALFGSNLKKHFINLWT